MPSASAQYPLPALTLHLFFASLSPPPSSSPSPPSLQDIEETRNTALNGLRELERQSSAKHAPDVVLDTLEQRPPSGPTPASSSESRGSRPHHHHQHHHAAALRPVPSDVPVRRSTSSSSDTMSTFKPMVAPRMGVQLKPPAQIGRAHV